MEKTETLPPAENRDHVLPKGKWEFDAEVTDVFEEMLRRSIPQYDVMRQAVFNIASRYAKDKSAIVDLGCSRGDALAPLVERFGAHNRFVGVEVSQAMLEAARKRFQLLFGATDIEDIMEAVNAAAVRPDVQAVFLDIDSPGGSVSGTPELAQAVSDLCKAKYTYAFSGGQMCSAAYWVASQCDAIYVSPSARVGSIGDARFPDTGRAVEQHLHGVPPVVPRGPCLCKQRCGHFARFTN